MPPTPHQKQFEVNSLFYQAQPLLLLGLMSIFNSYWLSWPTLVSLLVGNGLALLVTQYFFPGAPKLPDDIENVLSMGFQTD